MAADKFNLSARAIHRILKVSRTIADMDNAEQIAAIFVQMLIIYVERIRRAWIRQYC